MVGFVLILVLVPIVVIVASMIHGPIIANIFTTLNNSLVNFT